MKTPAVSVIIPVFEGAGLIERPLASLQEQSFTDFEVLCLDDCSPDSSADIIRGWSEKDPRIRYLRPPENLGWPQIMNFARDKVLGRWFIYSSQDDTFSPDWLEKLVAAAERTRADAVVPNLVMVDDDRGVFRRLINDWREPVTGGEAFLLSLDWTVPTNALWPARFLKEIGYFDFGTYADEYSCRVFFLNCGKVAFADSEFRYFHGNPEAITKKVSGRRLDDTYNNYRLWRLVREQFPGHPWDSRYAAQVLRSYFESANLLALHPELEGEKHRLQPAIEGMNSSEYLASLKTHLAGRPLSFLAARAIIRRPVIRRLATLLHFWGRRAKQSLPRLRTSVG